MLQKNSQVKKKLTKFTILKSPHINKSAQEQFEFRIFSRQVSVFSFQVFKLLVFFKRFHIKLFSDVRFQINLSINQSQNFDLYAFDPDDFQTLPFLEFTRPNIGDFNDYASLFDIYGEFTIRKFLNKSKLIKK